MSATCNLVVYSERSKRKLIYDGYKFIFDKNSKDQKTSFWRCDHKSRGCKARMHAVAGTNEFIRLMNEHDHERKTDEIVGQRDELPKVNDVQDNVEDSIKRLAGEIVTKIKDETNVDKLVKKRKLSECPSTSQINEGDDPKCNYHKMDFMDEILNDYKFFTPNEKFLLANNKSPQILIFGRESNASWIGQMKQIFVNSYRQHLPQPFTNLCVIWSERLASRGLCTFPILYVFLENESHSSYVKMFEMIKQFWPQFDPDLLTFELNKPLIDAAYEQFKEAAILGCFDSLRRQMQQFLKGKLDEYTLKDSQFILNCQMIASLAFLPEKQIQQTFNELAVYLSSDKTYSLVLQWFEDQFLGKRTKNNHKRPPYFTFQLWSCHQRILNADTLSNKNVSIVQRRIESEFNDTQSSESICDWFNFVRQLQNFFDSQMEKFLSGEAIGTEFEDQRDCQRRLFGRLNELDEKSNLVDFLFTIAQELGVE